MGDEFDLIDWGQGSFGDFDLSELFPEIDFSQFPELDKIQGAAPADPFQGLSPEDLSSLFGGANGLDYGKYISGLGKLFGGGGGGGGGLDGLLQSLGGITGLLGLGGTIYGGINSKNATEEAQARMEKAVSEANDSTRSILGGAGDAYKPYQEAGQSALARIAAMQPSNLAGQFGATGQQSNLASMARPGQQSNIAGRFRPIGSGRGIR